MAELLLQVNDGPRYKDGDIIAAFNQRRIHQCHIGHICNRVNFGFNQHGLRPKGTLSEDAQNLVYQYHFRRVSLDEVEMTDRFNDTTRVYGKTPHPEDGLAIDVQTFIASRIAHPLHRIFGAPGSEEWYGGREDWSDPVISQIWSAIEAKSAFREVDHRQWPLSARERRVWLPIGSDDFTEDERVQLEASRIEQVGTDPDTGEALTATTLQRERWVDWESIIEPRDRAKARNKDLEYDRRDTQWSIASVVQAKP